MTTLPNSPPLLVVTLVFKAKLEFSSLHHVVENTSALLDSATASGTVQALQQSLRLQIKDSDTAVIGHEENLRTDKHYNGFQFRLGIQNAVQNPKLEVIKWFFSHFYGCTVSDESVCTVAGQGNLEVLEYFLEHGVKSNVDANGEFQAKGSLTSEKRHFVCWGGDDMASASKNKHTDIVWWLHEHVRTGRRIYPIVKYAVVNGDVILFKWLESTFRTALLNIRERDSHLMEFAAETGRLDIMKWLFSHHYVKCPNMAVYHAVDKGRMDMIKWLIDNKLAESGDAMNFAFRFGQLDMVKELYRSTFSLQFPLSVDSLSQHDPIFVSENEIVNAARKGHLSVVQWLVETLSIDFQGSTLDETLVSTALDEAAGNGQLAMVKYLHHLNVPVNIGDKRKRECESRLKSMDVAAANNYLEVVQWLHANRPEGCSSKAMDLAASNGHLEMLRWLHVNRSEGCTTAAMDGAALHGHLDVVKWLHENTSSGCTVDAMNYAAAYGHLDVIKWLHENRSEGCTTFAMDQAAHCGKFEVVKWLHHNRSEGCTTTAMDLAAAERTTPAEMVFWLQKHRSEGCTTTAMNTAAEQSKFDVVLFLHSQRREGCTEEAIFETDLESRKNIHEWLEEHYQEAIARDH